MIKKQNSAFIHQSAPSWHGDLKTKKDRPIVKELGIISSKFGKWTKWKERNHFSVSAFRFPFLGSPDRLTMVARSWSHPEKKQSSINVNFIRENDKQNKLEYINHLLKKLT